MKRVICFQSLILLAIVLVVSSCGSKPLVRRSTEAQSSRSSQSMDLKKSAWRKTGSVKVDTTPNNLPALTQPDNLVEPLSRSDIQ